MENQPVTVVILMSPYEKYYEPSPKGAALILSLSSEQVLKEITMRLVGQYFCFKRYIDYNIQIIKIIPDHESKPLSQKQSSICLKDFIKREDDKKLIQFESVPTTSF